MKYLILLFISTNLYATDVATWDLGGFLFKDKVNVMYFNDPKVSGVTCHIAYVGKALSFSDPSNSSIACRKTGKIVIGNIDRSAAGEIAFAKGRSFLFKKMKIRRIFDKANNTLIYVSYITKAVSGSFKISVSTVSLYEGS